MRSSTALAIHLLLACLALQASGAPLPGTFMPVGNMSAGRYGHTATLLADGRVLIAGGGRGAEIYDPSTGHFFETGPMREHREHHSATLLANGKVLIVGGRGRATAELFDPANGTFEETGSMVSDQSGHAAVLLPNGKVLVAGGIRESPPYPTPTWPELYDPATGTFSAAGKYADTTGQYSKIPVWPKLSALADGRVLLVGNNPAQIYDPSTDSFSVTGRMISPDYAYGMFWHTTTTLEDGTVLVTGGSDDMRCAGFNSSEIYDPASGTFRTAGFLLRGRDLHTSTPLRDGTVLITGGGSSSCGGGSLESAELFDPSTQSFAAAGNMNVKRTGHTATLLQDGTVLLTGGFNSWPGPPLKSAEIYRPAETDRSDISFERLPIDANRLPRLLRELELRRLSMQAESRGGSSPAFLIPAVGTVNGARGTLFRTDVTFSNSRATEQDVVLAWLPQGNEDGPAVATFHSKLPALSGDAGGTLTITDFADELGVTGLGAIIVIAVDADGDLDGDAIVDGFARVRSASPCSLGSVSQSLPAVASQAFGTTARARALGLRHESAYRTNVGVVNLSDTAREFTIVIDGQRRSARVTIAATPFAPVLTALPEADYGSLAITVISDGNASWAAYGSTVDNSSADSWSSVAIPMPDR